VKPKPQPPALGGLSTMQRFDGLLTEGPGAQSIPLLGIAAARDALGGCIGAHILTRVVKRQQVVEFKTN